MYTDSRGVANINSKISKGASSAATAAGGFRSAAPARISTARDAFHQFWRVRARFDLVAVASPDLSCRSGLLEFASCRQVVKPKSPEVRRVMWKPEFPTLFFRGRLGIVKYRVEFFPQSPEGPILAIRGHLFEEAPRALRSKARSTQYHWCSWHHPLGGGAL